MSPAAASGGADEPGARRDPETLTVVAHRGASGTHPENTAAAFAEAVRLGVACIELDVHRSADGGLVVIHDATVDRTANGTGRVAELTTAQIKALDAGAWLDARFAGEPFLLLDEALDAIPASIRLNVHVKAYDEDRERVVPETVHRLIARNRLANAYLAADEASLAVARRVCPDLEICNLSTRPADDYVTRSARIGCRVLQPGHAMTTSELVRDAHAHGMEVNPFFADDEEEMRRLIDCGVDGILTNHPARLQALCRQVPGPDSTSTETLRP